MSKYLNLFLLIIFFNKIIVMQLNICDLPNELLLNINKHIIKSYINNWKNIYKFSKEVDKKKLIKEFNSIKLSCRKFNENFSKEFFIKNFNKLKKKRFEKLKNQIIFKNRLTEIELNLKLENLLNKTTISENDIEKCIDLIFSGADVNFKNKFGLSVLFYAIEKNLLDIVNIILDLNAFIDIQDNNGKTALMLASKNGNDILAKILIDNKADVNIKNNYGITALTFSILNNNIEIAKMLIAKGADIYDIVFLITLLANNNYLNLIKIFIKNLFLKLSLKF